LKAKLDASREEPIWKEILRATQEIKSLNEEVRNQKTHCSSALTQIAQLDSLTKHLLKVKASQDDMDELRKNMCANDSK